MKSPYNRLIFLAEELDTPSTAEKIVELNTLLASIPLGEVDQSHYSLLDGLISILWNTGNLMPAHQVRILRLQEEIRETN